MSKKEDITIITVAAHESGFIDLMIKSVFRFTNANVKIIICDNGNNSSYLDKYRERGDILIVKNSRARKYIPGSPFSPSMQHAAGLNIAFRMVDTDKVAIIETDCVVLHDTWYSLPNGADLKACVKGIGLGERYYYYPCFMVFNKYALDNGGKFDFSPSRKKQKGVGIPLSGIHGGKTYSDVGWRIGNRIEHDRVCELEYVKCSDEMAQDFYHDFGHKTNVFVDQNSNIIAGHFWRGSDLARRDDEHIKTKKIKSKWFDIVMKRLEHVD